MRAVCAAGCADRNTAFSVKAGIDIAGDFVQAVVLRGDITLHREGFSGNMRTGNTLILQGDIGSDLADIAGVTGIQIAGIAVRGADSVPVVAETVTVKAGCSIGLSCRGIAQGVGTIGIGAARLGIDGGAVIDFDLAVGRIISTGADIAFFIVRHTKVQIYDPAAAAAENTVTFGTAVTVGVTLNGDNIGTADANHKTHMGPASGEEQITLLGGVVITHETGVIIATGVQGRTTGIENHIEAVGVTAGAGGSANDGAGDAGHFGAPGHKGSTPGRIAAADGHISTDIIMIPVVCFGIVVVVTVILAAGISGIVTFTVANLRKGHINDVLPLVAGQFNIQQSRIERAGLICR